MANFLTPWPEIKTLAVLGTLALGWSGSVRAEVTLQMRVGPSSQETQAHDTSSPVHTSRAIHQPIPSERANGAEVDALQISLMDEVLSALASPAHAQHAERHIVQPGDILAAIADQYGVTLPMLKQTNHLDTDHIYPGQPLIIPMVALRIQIDKSENLLTLFNHREPVKTYPVATGDQGVTPVGTYTIANRLIGPTWYWQGYAVPPDDPEYPLGSRWLGLSKRGYGIHGTDEPESIGQQVSHGCIRMHNADVEELFDVVSVGTVVTIIE